MISAVYEDMVRNQDVGMQSIPWLNLVIVTVLTEISIDYDGYTIYHILTFTFDGGVQSTP